VRSDFVVCYNRLVKWTSSFALAVPLMLLAACSSNTNAQDGSTAANSTYEVGDEVTFAGPDGETLGSITIVSSELRSSDRCLEVSPPATSGLLLEVELLSASARMPVLDHTAVQITQRDGYTNDGIDAVVRCTANFPLVSSPPLGGKSRGFVAVGYSGKSPVAVVLEPTFTNDDANVTDVDSWYTEATPSSATVNLPS
jgi:hypothetical protein